MALSQNQKQMIADMLLRTNKKSDIPEMAMRIDGNAYGSKETVREYEKLAQSKVARRFDN